jgi:eukaryotic-like serine/threonine-protein kinase
MRVVERSLVAITAVVLLTAAGCKDSKSCATADDGGTDGGRVCTAPAVTCNAGEHAEYGACFAEADEVTIPAGTFTMGAPSGSDFVPKHSVTLAEFKLDRYEVTNARYQLCVDAGCCDPPTYDGSYTGREPYYGNPDFGLYPVVFVSWAQAKQFCEGAGKRLPTEAEWEYAARGGDERLYPWGSDSPSTARANFGKAKYGDTAQTGTHADGASPFGAEDLAGNVWEWVADWFYADYYASSPSDNPAGPENGVTKVARGGSFGSEATALYSFYRGSYLPEETFGNLGFRCAR